MRGILTAIALGALAVAGPVAAQDRRGDDRESSREGDRTRIDPYIEVSQIVTWQFDPVDETVTYTQVAAGVDAQIRGRNSGAAIALRYERNFAWDGNARDTDTLTGIVRGYTAIVPRTLQIEAGALASRTRTDGSGGSLLVPVIGDDDTVTKTYSAYAGPTLSTRVDDVKIDANYRIGYTRVEGPDFVTLGGDAVDLFDESVAHSAMVRAATSPDMPFPVGVGVGAGFYQEDIDTLDQRVRDAYVRGDVTVPVTPTLAIVAGAGVEDVEVSSRDALRDTDGNPIVGPNGRYLVDGNSPRQIAYEAEGLIWDVGVIWRPSSRTQLQATFGRRYDSDAYYGSFTWQPSSRSNFGIAVYDSIQGFGGRLNNALAALPTDFEVIRDPISGDITGCTSPTLGTNCLSGLLGSVRSSVFRGRGVTASYTREVGRMTAGFAAGYDNRKFIAAPGTILEAANDIVDESYYVTAGVSGPAWRGNFSVNTFANWFDSGIGEIGDTFAYGSAASYYQSIWQNLSARAALSVYAVDTEVSDADLRAASALLGLRYDF
ncbi:preprotein translocase subunit YajC [Qipengyuania gaetbuli]|uniref:preprotein translocase subunit YajC n=1 Tax=Qipengyuania gaetbuli TaxID=266952 RepID=UPI001C992F16|nr:preprotein translocase subunit YajC [Qipengyuania gaetbuli]MBY6013829.1 preprotein translocase subunit YajC [Qipengyuania gaetbuli]